VCEGGVAYNWNLHGVMCFETERQDRDDDEQHRYERNHLYSNGNSNNKVHKNTAQNKNNKLSP